VSKRADFLAGLRSVEEREGIQRHPRPVVLNMEVPAGAPAPPPVTPRVNSRAGKVTITTYVDPLARKQVAQLGLDLDRDQQSLVNEALNLLFEKYGKPPIA